MSGLPPTIADGSVTLTFPPSGVYYGYCTIADTKYEFPNLTDTYTTLDNSSIAQEITYAAQEMQDLLDYAYVMPYTGSNTGILLTLRNMNAKLAAANCIDRYFTASVPNKSEKAAELRSWAELMLHDIIHGVTRWEKPFGDATSRGQLPVYQTSSGASITPSPRANDGSEKPIFSIGRSAYRRDVL